MEVTRGNGNTIGKEQLEKINVDVLGDLSKAIAHTLGPCGANTLVMEPYASAPITPSKDGYRLMLNYRYDNLAYEAVYRIVRDISARMNAEVGDGTTSGIIIAYAFYQNILKYLKKNNNFFNKKYIITPYGVNIVLTTIQTVLDKFLNKYIISIADLSKEEKLDVYKRVGTISANNDPEIGNIIGDVYGKTDSEYMFVDVTRSDTEDTIICEDVGFEFPAGHIDRRMATESDGITCEYKDPLYLLIDGPLIDSDLPSIQGFIESIAIQNNRPLVIMAAEYTQNVVNYFIQLRSGVQVEGSENLIRVPVVALIVNTASALGNERLRDLEAALGAKALPTKDGKLINPPKGSMEFMKLCGGSKKFKSVPFHCRITGALGIKSEIEGRVNQIESELKAKNDLGQDSMVGQERIETLKRRIAMLRGEMTNVKVGGINYKEKESRRLLVEDAVCAVKAAINSGITLGGNVSIPKCIRTHKTEIRNEIIHTIVSEKKNVVVGNNITHIASAVDDILDVVAISFESAFKNVLHNAYLNKKKVETIYNSLNTDNEDDALTTFNLVTGEKETLDLHTKLIVPGKTDKELMRSVFGVVGIFITSNQLMSFHIPTGKK